MAVPEVDKHLLEELQAMGFSLARANRALHYSGNSNVEDAVNWIIDHENDLDIDQMPLVPVEISLDAPEPFPITEIVKMKAEELRNGSYKSREVKEKELEREREKERIRSGKRLQAARRSAEENERKRMLAFRHAEKEEEKQARERIRQKLEADKAERRSKLGISAVPPASLQPVSTAVKQNFVQSSTLILPSRRAELLRDCLRTVKRNYKNDDAKVKRAFQTLWIYVRNVMKSPDVEKYRTIRLSNPVFQERVGNLQGGIKFLELCGFERANRGEFLYLPRDKIDMSVLNSAMLALHSAMTNPFFGLFSMELDIE